MHHGLLGLWRWFRQERPARWRGGRRRRGGPGGHPGGSRGDCAGYYPFHLAAGNKRIGRGAGGRSVVRCLDRPQPAWQLRARPRNNLCIGPWGGQSSGGQRLVSGQAPPLVGMLYSESAKAGGSSSGAACSCPGVKARCAFSSFRSTRFSAFFRCLSWRASSFCRLRKVVLCLFGMLLPFPQSRGGFYQRGSRRGRPEPRPRPPIRGPRLSP